MFGRGNWAIVGLVKESVEGFQISLENQALMAASSQLAAAAVARLYGADALGINPYCAPRLDEEQELAEDQQAALARFALAEQEDGARELLAPEIQDGPGYGRTAHSFQIHPNLPWYALWAVSNEWKKASDLPSIKEQKSYVALERPYKFLQALDRKTVDQETVNATTIVRKQVPVLVDFNEGRVYIESTDKKQIQAILVRLSQLGAEIIPVAWNYGSPNWTEAILNQLYEQTQFADEFMKRAEESKRFRENEIERLEDRELEAIVSKFFSMTELPGGVWVGISGPARIRLHDTAQPIGVKSPAGATTLLQITDGAGIVEAALTFQEVATVVTKDGAERRIRRDLARLNMNNRINLTEVGAAMLRGFDLTTHKKDVQREIKQTRQVPTIPQFWGAWLHQLNTAARTMASAFREILEIDGSQPAGIVPMQVTGPAAAPGSAAD
ncbi:MAG: hypothetical protein HY821_07250 [Acidobacteria bacterium]|nr:hypothetical protein [Acidobacteriota bacterium]